MDLSQLALWAQVVGSVGVVIAIVFGIAQLRQFQQQRGDTAAAELMRSFQDPAFNQSFLLIHSLPDGLSAAQLRAMGAHYEQAALSLGVKFETVGLLVFRGNIPIAIAEELIGGITVALWRTLEPWIRDTRAEQGNERFLEWFQWLAERFAERRSPQDVPAYAKHRGWSPRR